MRTRALPVLLALSLLAACEGDPAAGGADTVAADSGGADAPAAERPIDFKVMVDRAALDPTFAAPTRIEVAGSFSAGQPLVAVDDGGEGDDLAGDGVYVLRLSDHRPADDPLLKLGDRAEFAVLLDGAAYEGPDGTPLAAGVSAWSTWVPRAVPGWEREVVTHVPTDDGGATRAVVIGPE